LKTQQKVIPSLQIDVELVPYFFALAPLFSVLIIIPPASPNLSDRRPASCRVTTGATPKTVAFCRNCSYHPSFYSVLFFPPFFLAGFSLDLETAIHAKFKVPHSPFTALFFRGSRISFFLGTCLLFLSPRFTSTGSRLWVTRPRHSETARFMGRRNPIFVFLFFFFP